MYQLKVSAIIPFYNGVDWLCEAVQSVLDQTYKNIEIIVVNDGSPEDISPFLEKYGDKIIYECQENQGPSVARNTAISLATGDFVAFLDSDDIWLPEKTEKQLKFMEITGAEWSHTGYYRWWPNRDSVHYMINNSDYGFLGIKFLISVSIATPSVMIRQTALRQHQEIVFDPAYRKGQDTRYFKAMNQHYPLALLQEPLVKVRLRKGVSYASPLSRFAGKANAYQAMKNDKTVPAFIRFIYSIYSVYSKVFRGEETSLKVFIAKCFWTFPYFLERIYLKVLLRNKNEYGHLIMKAVTI